MSRPRVGDAECVRPFEVPAAAKLVDPEVPLVPVAETAARQLDDSIGDRELGIDEDVFLGVFAEQDPAGWPCSPASPP